ncbi:hypothetical protein WJX81_005432 [Elliptochloris bilobata]|uniref:Cell division control protein n=1 Tax=Elliptochloris bilobata TaxID=381761 RepID=A0AAW1S5K1_9CHLO
MKEFRSLEFIYQGSAGSAGAPAAEASENLPPAPTAGATGFAGCALGWFDPIDQQKVHEVKTALHVSAAPGGAAPLCREAQLRELEAALQALAAEGRGGALYVSGLPGSGKSLTVHEALRRAWRAERNAGRPAPRLVSINCMTLAHPTEVFSRIAAGLAAPPADAADPIMYPGPCGEGVGNASAALAALKAAAQAPSAATPKARGVGRGRRSAGGGKGRPQGLAVVVLDEMDQLLAGDPAVLTELFLLPKLPGARLVLAGVANSLDLTERALPLLAALGARPHLLPFPAYDAGQLQALLSQRLARLPGPVFQPQALRLCAKKVASRSGDMRRALEACASALDQLLQAAGASVPRSPGQHGGMQPATAGAGAAAERRLVSIGDMAVALSKAHGGTGEGAATVVAIRALPQQQQLLLCAAMRLLGARAPATPSASGGVRSPCFSQGRRLSVGPSPASARRLSAGGSGRRLSTAAGYCTPRAAPLGRMRDCLLAELAEAYRALCHQVGFGALGATDFSAACSTLADHGLLGLGPAREQRLRRVTLRAAADDVVLALRDLRLFSTVLGAAKVGAV